jgi:hypothetical protein
MKKSSLSWTLPLMVAVVTLSMPLYGLKVAEDVPGVPQAEPPVVNPAEPEKDGLEAVLPVLFIQKPSFVCWGNWECVEQWGPGYLCSIPPGQTQGYCY